MTTNRLEAFSDGVLAIIITIMVLELKIPEGHQWGDLQPLLPKFISYILSFIYLGIYWNNHHHLMHVATNVNGRILWANLHLLFWLSLLPFATGFMGENHFQPIPTAIYGLVLFLASMAWNILILSMKKSEDKSSLIHTFYGKGQKGSISSILYLLGALISFKIPWVAALVYLFVAFFWLLPDRKVE